MKLSVSFVSEIEKICTASSCPQPLRDAAENMNNLSIAVGESDYGPMEGDVDYWKRMAVFWKSGTTEAMRRRCGNCSFFDTSPRMAVCIPRRKQGGTILGYCHVHLFACNSARTCQSHEAGKPIDSDEVSMSLQERSESH